jgi:DNA-binding XRE family transcriptional regulator
MARGALDISAADLSKLAKIAKSTVLRFERDEGRFIVDTVAALTKALEKKGIVFLDADEQKPGGFGVRLKKGRTGTSGAKPGQTPITPAQLRMARAALDMKADDLAGEAALTSKTILNFEQEKAGMHSSNAMRVQAVLERHGIVFLAADEERPGGLGIRYNEN